MTGFGAGAASLGAGRYFAEARSVNHRFLDLRVQLPDELEEHQFAIEQAARARLERGRVDLRFRSELDAVGSLELDVARARKAFEALALLRDELAPEAPLPLSLLAVVPDLFRAPAGPDAATVREALLEAMHAALDGLVAMREREGDALAAELRRHLARVRDHVAFVRAASAALPEQQRERLRLRIAALAGDVAVDAARLATEVALFADRADVTEELVRLESHVDQAEAMLSTSEPIGRRLDFLFQEMGREANTIGSKSPDAAIAQRVVTLKADLERLRQQVANVE